MANTATVEQARTVKAQLFEVFGKTGLVASVGIARIGKGYCVKVNVESPLPSDQTLPESIDGVAVRVEVVGKVIPQQEAWLYKNAAALASVQKGLQQARAGKFTKTPPDLDADASLVDKLDD